MVLGSVVPVFGLIALSFAFSRRFRPDLSITLRLTAQLFIPCLIFSSVLQAEVEPDKVRDAVLATLTQIGCGFAVGGLGVWLLSKRFSSWRNKRELLLPIAFVNSANLPFPIVLANFGTEGLSYAVVCFLVTNFTVFTVGTTILHGGRKWRDAFKEPVLPVTFLAFALRLAGIHLPPEILGIPKLAGQAAVPLMLLLFGDALARTRMRAPGVTVGAVILRYASGALALWLTLTILQPEGTLRSVLTLYALLPSAVVNVVLAQRAGRDAPAVASVILGATLVALFLIPWLLGSGAKNVLGPVGP
ncbi:MAG: AEC family transporter [Candidatus Eisenbacteria bacterium]